MKTMKCRLWFVRTLARTLVGAALLWVAAPLAHAQGEPMAATLSADTVHVAPPAGETETDRANVQAAFDAVQAGGTVLFEPGTYLLGAGVQLTVPDVTVLGHTDGTVLRGCNPEEFDEIGMPAMVFGCTGFYIQTQRQTIRGLTFEYMWHGIVVGPYPTTLEEGMAMMQSGEPEDPYPAGGQRIEGNTFRASANGLRVTDSDVEVSIVRDNDFIDVYHAIGIYGAPLHFLDNRIRVTEPERIPNSRHPGSAILISAGATKTCAQHVVSGNTISGYHDGIYVMAMRGEVCRGIELRDNTVEVRRVSAPREWPVIDPTAEDTTVVGIPISLVNITQVVPRPGASEDDPEGVLEDILVEGNRIIGAEGLGIEVLNASRNRIVGNTITQIERREPFPGNNWGFLPPTWETANGSAIWVSAGSEGNVIAGNTFEAIAGEAVVVEGDRNEVMLRSTDNTVRDLGSSNRVTQQPEDH